MNWQHFQTYNDSPTHAFEAMCNQIFELWCKRTYSSKSNSFSVVNGAGGDGGVEAYNTLEDNKVVAVQSKWFLDSISVNQFNQIKNSVKTALYIRPQIIKYIICVPRDLASEKIGRGKKIVKDTESNRWESLKTTLSSEFPQLEIELWNDTRLLEELQHSEATGIFRYWFEKSEISQEILTASFEKQQCGWLSQRYLPSLHSKGVISKKIDGFIGEVINRKACHSKLIEIEKLYLNLVKHANDYLSILRNNDQKEEIIKSVKNIEIEADKVIKCINIMKQGLITDCSVNLNEYDSWGCIDFGLIINHLKEQRHNYKTPFHVSAFKDAIKAFEDISVKSIVAEISNQLSSFRLLILGNPGTGKTHGIVDVVKKITLTNEHTAILISAKSISNTYAWKDIISRTLGLSSMWSEDEIWCGLEALSFRNEVNRAVKKVDSEFYIIPKVLVCIDGVDESRPYEVWIDRFREMELICKRHPRIRFCITSRSYAFDGLSYKDSLLQNKVVLPSDGDVSVSDLFERYMKHFNIDVSTCGWLKWSIKTPLALKLFCELNEGKKFDSFYKPILTITKLIEKKIENIDCEFRAYCNNEYSINDYIVRNAVACLASYFFKNHRITKEEILRLLSDNRGLIMLSIKQKNKLVQHLENYGLVQSYVIDSGDILCCPIVYYEIGIQPIFDYLLAFNLAKQIKNQTIDELPDSIKHNQGALQMASIILLDEYQILISDNSICKRNISKSKLFDLICFALSNVEPILTQKYIFQIKNIMSKNAHLLREVVNKIVLNIARIEDHPLGPILLHDFLLSYKSVGERDIIWSVPGNLHGDRNSKWHCWNTLNLQENEYKLTMEDKSNGLPLVYSWALTIIDNPQRAYYRKELVKWGQLRPQEFLSMLQMVYETNDPQMKEELLSIAMGVAFSIDRLNSIVGQLAEWVLTEIFAPDKIENTFDAAVRYYARAIAERAYACGFISLDSLKKSKPPYNTSLTSISLSKEATKGTRMGGFRPIDYDLSRYVICDPIDRFFFRASKYVENEEVQKNKGQALFFTGYEIEDILSTKSYGLTETCRSALKKALREARSENLYPYNLEDIIEKSISSEMEEKERIENAFEEQRDAADTNKNNYIYYKEADEFLAVHALVVEKDNLEPCQFSLSACFAYILSMGWNKEDFYGHPNGGKIGEVLGVDLAIGRNHRSATHGSKSTIMSFCEKYVWCARNEIFGYLADRLPIREEHGIRQMVYDYGVLDDFVNPAQELNQVNPDEMMRNVEWYIPELLSPTIDYLGNTCVDIIKWIDTASIPDFEKWIFIDNNKFTQLQAYGKPWISLYNCTCVSEPIVGTESIIWVSSAIINDKDFHCLIKDFRAKREHIIHEFDNPEDLYSSTEADTYITPKEICWMDWKRDYYGTILNSTIDKGNIYTYKIEKAVERTACNYDEYGEVFYKLPSKAIRKMLNIVDGNGYEYFDIEKNSRAIYIKFGEVWKDSQAILCVDKEKLLNSLALENKCIFWVVRLLRQPSAKSMEKYDKLSYRRDRNWIVWFENGEMKSQLFIDTTD